MPRSTKVRRSSAPQKRQGFKAVCCEDSEVSVMVAMEFSMILGKQITLESQGWDGFPHRQTTLKGQKVGNELEGNRRVPLDRLPPRESQTRPVLYPVKGNQGAKQPRLPVTGMRSAPVTLYK